MKNKYFELTQHFQIIEGNYNVDGQKGKKVKDISNDEFMFISNGVDILPIDEYKKEIEFKNRRELLNKFDEILPFTVNRLLQIVYYKKPDFKSLYKRKQPFTSQKAYEFAHRYGERRVMQGQFVVKDNKFKERDGYLLMMDIEDNNIEKPIIVRNMISFIFDGIKYYINEK